MKPVVCMYRSMLEWTGDGAGGMPRRIITTRVHLPIVPAAVLVPDPAVVAQGQVAAGMDRGDKIADTLPGSGIVN